jgi:L,D-transpeptidase YcbB
VRTLSHGCVRLERPAELAEWVLGWDPSAVERALHDGPNDRAVRLPRKIPVYLVYATAYERDGALHFGSDIYDRDETLVAAVAGSAGLPLLATR